MIIQCEACKTKFRVGDDKVKPPGIKVRCSKCGEVFFFEYSLHEDHHEEVEQVSPFQEPESVAPEPPAESPLTEEPPQAEEQPAAVSFDEPESPAEEPPWPGPYPH